MSDDDATTTTTTTINDSMEEEETRRFERQLPDHEPEKVWRALTEAKELAAWFPAKVANDIAPPAPGDAVTFEENNGEIVEGEVIESNPPHRLTYTMGRERLQFDLSRMPEGGCLLVLTVRDEPANQQSTFKCAA